MVGPRALYLFCLEFEDVSSFVTGLDGKESFELIHVGLSDATCGMAEELDGVGSFGYLRAIGRWSPWDI